MPKSESFIKKEREIHPSHTMSEWRSTIISMPNSDRFGQIRVCEACEAEQAKTVTGTFTHKELWSACPYNVIVSKPATAKKKEEK